MIPPIHLGIGQCGDRCRQLIQLNCLLRNLLHAARFFDALHLFHRIHSSHRLNPDHYTLSTAITASANLPDSLSGSQLHAHSIRSGLKSFPHVSNTLLSLYAKCKDFNSVNKVFDEISCPDVYSRTTLLSACVKLGKVEYALHLFDEMPQRDLPLWNAVITGCGESDYVEIVSDLFLRMRRLDVKPDHYTFASVLSLCSPEKFQFGRQLHCLVVKTGFLWRPSVVNSLLTMYFNGGSIADGYGVFDEVGIHVGDAITYNSIIAGLMKMERYEEALSMFKDMLSVGLKPTESTFVSVMGACFCLKLANQVHGQAVKMKYGDCTSVNNAAISMYSNCRDISSACLVFRCLRERDTVSWNAIIGSYAQQNLGKDAVVSYVQMQRDGIRSDEFTIGSLLTSAESEEIVEMIQAVVTRNGLISHVEVMNALLSVYFKNGAVEKSGDLFREMPSKNLISWNALVSGLLQNGFPSDGLFQFLKMMESGLQPNHYTLSLVLNICATTSDLLHGKQIHAYILKFNYFSNMLLRNSLITLYSKCGSLDSSLRVFHSIVEKDTISWNSIISAYSQYGEGKEAIQMFEIMRCCTTVIPDEATFTAVLSACSHSGLVEEGVRIFNLMVDDYHIYPNMHHLSCIVDLLCRAGLLDAAEGMINVGGGDMDPGVWWALLSSCVDHGHLQLGRVVAKYLIEGQKDDDPAVYVLLSNLNANAGKWEESANLRELITERGVMKQPGSSWIAP